MYTAIRQGLFLLAVVMLSIKALAFEYDISGYVSLYAGQVIEGHDHGTYISEEDGLEYPKEEETYNVYDCPCFIADFTRAAVYEEDKLSVEPDSRAGIQFIGRFGDKVSAIIQARIHGGDDDAPDLSWAYLRYQITDELAVDVGRKALPLYFYSDFLDVGYAYPWIRVPGNIYGWPITSYNGLAASYSDDLGDGSFSVGVWYGEEKEKDSEEYDKLYYWGETYIKWKNMWGVSFEYSYDWLTVRLVHMENKTDSWVDYKYDANEDGNINRDDYWVLADDTKQKFTGLAIVVDYGPWQIRSEYNEYKIPEKLYQFESEGTFFSLGYRIGSFTPTLSYSLYKDDDIYIGDSKGESSSFTLRWDFMKDMAFKFQYDEIDDNSAWDFVGDSKAVAMGVDYVF